MFDSSATRPRGLTGTEERKARSFPETEIQRLKRYILPTKVEYICMEKEKRSMLIHFLESRQPFTENFDAFGVSWGL